MTPAVGYLRVSSSGQCDDDKFGLPRQRETITKFCEARGYELVNFYEERGVSGTTDESARPAFRQMLVELLANGCRTVIVEALDRFARKRAIQDILLGTLVANGISLIAADTGENVTESMSSGDPMRKFIVGIQGDVAELQKDALVLRLLKSRKAKRALGLCVEGRKPYGTKPGEAERLAFIQHHEGCTHSQIAKLMDERGWLTRYGKKWSPSTIAKIRKRSLGQVIHNGSPEITVDSVTHGGKVTL